MGSGYRRTYEELSSGAASHEAAPILFDIETMLLNPFASDSLVKKLCPTVNRRSRTDMNNSVEVSHCCCRWPFNILVLLYRYSGNTCEEIWPLPPIPPKFYSLENKPWH